MKSTFSSLFYVSLRKCSVRCSFSFWYRTWRDEAQGEQSKSKKISLWNSPTNVRLPSSVCQTNAQNADGPLDRTDIVWGSKQCQKIWCGSWSQSDAVISLLAAASCGSKTHQMHYWSRNITANFTWHEYANLRNITPHIVLSNLTSYCRFSPISPCRENKYLYISIVFPREHWHQMESTCKLHLLRNNLTCISSRVLDLDKCTQVCRKSLQSNLNTSSNISHQIHAKPNYLSYQP